MAEYMFTLQKYRRGSKLTCPKCGRKQCFVKYVDTEGQIVFPDYVGRCDHEHSCQYHYKPSDYFKDNSIVQEDWKPRMTHPKQYYRSRQITQTVKSCTAHSPTTNGIHYSLFFREYLEQRKHPEYFSYIVSALPRSGAVLRCFGKLTNKEKCGQGKSCFMTKQQGIG